MNIFSHRILPFAAIVLFAGSVSAQITTPVVQSEKSKQLYVQDVSTYASEDTYALPWAPIMEHNILWRKRAWRDIDAHDPANKAFSNDAAKPRKNYLVNILLQAAFDGKIKAYDAIANDRFTKILTRDDLIALVSPSTGFNPDHVSKYRIKEDWLCLKEENKIVERIIGVAPVIEVKGADGSITERVLFWVYVPDNRDFLAQQKVYNEDVNWDEVLVGSKYSSKIVKENIMNTMPYRTK